MSIIHDALKKAQKQKTEQPSGVPFGSAPEAKGKLPYIIIGIIAIVAAAVALSVFVPSLLRKNPIPAKQTASVKGPALPTVPAKPAAQKDVQADSRVNVPPVATAAAVNNEVQPDAKQGQNKKSVIAVPVTDREQPIPAPAIHRRHKAPLPAEEEGPIRRIPVRRTEDDLINRQYNDALQFMNSGQYREAQKIFLGILQRRPDHVESLNNMGIAAASLGNRKEAVMYFNKVFEYRPNYPKAYNNIGLVLMSDGNSQLAEEYFRKAVSLEPESLEPYLNLSALLRAEKKFPEAAKVLENPIGRNVKDANLYLAYAVAKDNMGHAGQAIQYYRQYLGIAKSSQVRSGVVERLRYLEERGKK